MLGNQIKNQTSDAALFQDLGNSPATFEGFRWALTDRMCRWLMRCRHISKPRYGARLVGSSFHPKPFLKTTKNDGISSKDLWVRLVKALCGHPDAGALWEQHCDESVRAIQSE